MHPILKNIIAVILGLGLAYTPMAVRLEISWR